MVKKNGELIEFDGDKPKKTHTQDTRCKYDGVKQKPNKHLSLEHKIKKKDCRCAPLCVLRV